MSMRSKALIAAIALAPIFAASSFAEGPLTFTKDVLPIMQDNCQTCHRASGTNLSGMIAPMAFTTYEDVRPWAKSIAQVVGSREMPPWGATAASHGSFKNERTLTQDEIDTIVKWTQTGARRGNDADAPAPREFPNTDGWTIGKPDLVVAFEEAFFVNDDVADLYHNVTVQLTEAMLPEDKFIKALEFRPGSEVVHHIIAHASAPGATGRRGRGGMIGGMAPGTDAPNYPDGYGIPLVKGSSITFAMHYHKEKGPGTGRWDQSEIGLIFHDKPVTHPLRVDAISNGRFEIPPNTADWKVGMSRIFEEDTTVLMLMPHTHLRGQEARYVAFYPDGTNEELLHVPKYDFNWQTEYAFREPKQLPAGTRLEAVLVYDNSERRQEIAPEINPNRAVRFGGPTTDEMDLAWLTYANTEPEAAPE